MTKKRIAAIIIDSILILLTISFIFGNSLMDVKQSTNASDSVTEMVEKLPPVQNAIQNNKITKNDLDRIIRSFAHIIEFCALGIETMLLLLLAKLKPLSLSVFLPFFFCLILGLADECLQLRTDRAAEVIDVLKDFAGSLVGGLAVLAIYSIISIYKRKKA